MIARLSTTHRTDECSFTHIGRPIGRFEGRSRWSQALIADQILTFETAGQRFAVRAEEVREVIRAAAVTPLPGAPEVVDGVIDLRGEIVPVLDLRGRLGLQRRPVSPSDRFIVTTVAGRTVILRVDEVGSLVGVPGSGAMPLPEVWRRDERVAGVVQLDDGLTLIYDVLRFLSPAEELAVEEALRRYRRTEESE